MCFGLRGVYEGRKYRKILIFVPIIPPKTTFFFPYRCFQSCTFAPGCPPRHCVRHSLKKKILNINYVVFPGVYPSDISSLYRSTEIEQTDDIHAELVEDEDEEVMFSTYKIQLICIFSNKFV